MLLSNSVQGEHDDNEGGTMKRDLPEVRKNYRCVTRRMEIRYDVRADPSEEDLLHDSQRYERGIDDFSA